MILDRLKAQPELMEALGLGVSHGSIFVLRGGHTLRLDDQTPGARYLIVECLLWLHSLSWVPSLRPSVKTLNDWCVVLPGSDAVFFAAPTLVEAALLAVLEVAEGK